MENHQFCSAQNWWLNEIFCLLTIDYFTKRAAHGWYLGIFLPGFAYVDPSQTAGSTFQLVRRQLHGTGGGTGCGVDDRETLQGNIQVDCNVFVDTKGTHAANTMADQGLHSSKGSMTALV